MVILRLVPYSESVYILSIFKYFIHVQSQFREKNPAIPIEKCSSLLLSRNAIMSQHLIIQFLLCYVSSGRLRVAKNKRKFQTGLGRVQEVPNAVI